MQRKIREALDKINVPMLRQVWADLEHRLYYLRGNDENHTEIRYCNCIIQLKKIVGWKKN